MNSSYLIITPVFNEQQYLRKTIESVLAQTCRPVVWYIVDDDSTDRTVEIIKFYSQRYPWIHYVYRKKTENQMYYASNVYAINAGFQQAEQFNYNYLAILDGDIQLPSTYYETIIGRMDADETLGVASGIYENIIDGKLIPVLNDRRSTPKAIMVFRRNCYEEIGGFLPLKHGGEDTGACVMARMKGWKVWSYPDLKVVHNRPTGLGKGNKILKVRFNQGFAEWAIGSHWLFVVIKCMKRMLLEKPYIIGGLCRWAGFLQGCISREDRIVSPEFIRFFRREQLERILHLNRLQTCSNSENKDPKP